MVVESCDGLFVEAVQRVGRQVFAGTREIRFFPGEGFELLLAVGGPLLF